MSPNIKTTTNLISWKFIFFIFFIPSAKASIVDQSYVPYQDLFDGIFTVLFPIFIASVLSHDNNSRKKKLLPILDDILYNVVTWLIPLFVSFFYDHLLVVKIFALVNMLLHVSCATITIYMHKTIKQMNTELELQYISQMIRSFLIFFPVIVIPIFWSIYIPIVQHNFDPANVSFLVLFGLISSSILLMLLIYAFQKHEIHRERRWMHIFAIFWFYIPNLLQTLLIIIKWPISPYFVKSCIFVLFLSLTRNSIYYIDKLPNDFLATSTTLVQSFLSSMLHEEDSRAGGTISRSSKPFAFTPENLSRLFETESRDQNLSLLERYGGISGLIKGLHSDSQTGLDRTAQLEPITFKEITTEDSDTLGDEENNRIDEQNPVEDSPFNQRIKVFGKNSLPEKRSKFIFELMWMTIQEKSLIFLIIVAYVSLILGLYRDVKEINQPKIHWVEGVAIIITILIVVLVGSLNDWQKERRFQKLNAKKDDREVEATRNNKKTSLSVNDILVGDILHLKSGDITAADGVLIFGHGLFCDEPVATAGNTESERISRLKDPKTDPFIISGSKVLRGIGTYLVTGIGVNSFNGKIMMSSRTEPKVGPFQEKLNDFAEKIAKLGGIVAFLMLVTLLIKYFVGFHNGKPATEILDDLNRIIISTIILVIVAVPEGLPLAITLGNVLFFIFNFHISIRNTVLLITSKLTKFGGCLKRKYCLLS